MADMTTVLKVHDDGPGRRVFSVDGHSVAAPRLVIQKKTTAATPDGLAKDELQIVYGAFDSDGVPLSSKNALTLNIKRANNARSTEFDQAIALFKEIVASDNLLRICASQDYLDE